MPPWSLMAVRSCKSRVGVRSMAIFARGGYRQTRQLARLPACLPAYLFASLLACLRACLPACLPASLLASLPPCLPPCLPACLSNLPPCRGRLLVRWYGSCCRQSVIFGSLCSRNQRQTFISSSRGYSSCSCSSSSSTYETRKKVAYR